jgi:hypothetical protein
MKRPDNVCLVGSVPPVLLQVCATGVECRGKALAIHWEVSAARPAERNYRAINILV